MAKVHPVLKKFNAVSPQKSPMDSPSQENIILDDDFDFSYISDLIHDDQDVHTFPLLICSRGTSHHKVVVVMWMGFYSEKI